MVSEDIIADCVYKFIEDWAHIDNMGHYAYTTSEILDLNITSPPEQLWYAAAVRYRLSEWASIHPQHPIDQYRADFMLNPLSYFVDSTCPLYPQVLLEQIDKSCARFVIEIDGFEWHDKTPEQAEKDKRRERHIVQCGYKVLRYAAREVLSDPMACIVDVSKLINKELQEVSNRIVMSWR